MSESSRPSASRTNHATSKHLRPLPVILVAILAALLLVPQVDAEGFTGRELPGLEITVILIVLVARLALLPRGNP